MKHLKLFFLVAAGFMAATAIVDVSTALSTALCKEEPKAGVCSSPYGEVSFGSETKEGGSLLQTFAGSIVCGSRIGGVTLEPPTGEGLSLRSAIEQLKFSNCKLNGSTECAITVIGLNYIGLFQWTKGGNGKLELKEKGSGPPAATIVCDEAINCTYNLEVILDVQGGKVATIVASSETMKMVSGTMCPGSAPVLWSATHMVSEPGGGTIFVASH